MLGHHWWGKIRKITVLHLCQRNCLWIFRFGDPPMTILVFIQTRIFVHYFSDPVCTFWLTSCDATYDFQFNFLWLSMRCSLSHQFLKEHCDILRPWHVLGPCAKYEMAICANILGLQCSEFSSSFHLCSWMQTLSETVCFFLDQKMTHNKRQFSLCQIISNFLSHFSGTNQVPLEVDFPKSSQCDSDDGCGMWIGWDGSLIKHV